jgi:hypothetical protein
MLFPGQSGKRRPRRSAGSLPIKWMPPMTLAIACTFLDHLCVTETPRPARLRSVTSLPRQTPPPRQNLSSLFAFEALVPNTTNLAPDPRAQARITGEPANDASLREHLETLRHGLNEQHDRWR